MIYPESCRVITVWTPYDEETGTWGLVVTDSDSRKIIWDGGVHETMEELQAALDRLSAHDFTAKAEGE